MKVFFENTQLDENYYYGIKQKRLMFNENEAFSLGSTICNEIIFNIDRTYIEDNAIPKPNYVVITDNNETYGTYIVDNVEKNDTYYTYTLADKMVNFNFYYNAKPIIDASSKSESGIKYVYLQEILYDICNKAGVNINSGSTQFLGYDKHISYYDNTITAREYLSYIAELNGGYAIINKDGELELRQLLNEPLETISIDYVENYELGEYHNISRVALENGIGQFTPIGTETYNTLYLNPNNVYITEQEDLQNIYNLVNGYVFYSLDIKRCPIFIDIETGDCIAFNDGTNDYKTYAQYELEYNGEWIGGYKFIVGSEKREETEVINGTQENYKRVKTQIDRNNGEIKFVIENVNEQDNKISQITQTVDEINAKIQDITDITVSGESTMARVPLTNVNESEPIIIKIRPIGQNISYLYPRSNLYPSGSLYSTTRTLMFHNTTTNEYIPYTLPDNLLYYNSNIYDEFNLGYETQTCTITKRCEYDAQGNVVPLAQEETHNITPYPSILLTDGDYEVYLVGYTSGYIYVTLMASNIYTTQFYTKAETNSQIQQKADDINLSVDQKLSNYSTTQETSAQIDVGIGTIRSEVSTNYYTKQQTDGKYETQTNAETQYSRITQNTNSITSEVASRTASDGELSSRISQTAKSIALSVGTSSGKSTGITITTTKEDGTQTSSSGTIELSGDVVVKSNLTDGSTTISGSNIKTGTIDASQVNVTNIKAGNITSGTINANNINVTNINGTNITRGTITNIPINGGTIKNASYTFQASMDAIRIIDEGADAIIGGLWGQASGGNTRWMISNYSDNARYSTFVDGRARAYFDKDGAHASSDIRCKDNITNIEEEKSLNIIKNLTPIEYTYKDETKYHRGLSAQEVEEVLIKNNINNQIYEIDEKSGTYSLNYIELIPDLINCIKYQQKEIEELKNRISNLEENQINDTIKEESDK